MSRVEEILELIRRVISSHTCELAGFRVLLFGSRAEETAYERPILILDIPINNLCIF